MKPFQTPPNSSLSFFKKLPNKVIELLSLPLLYSTLPPFLNIQTGHKSLTINIITFSTKKKKKINIIIKLELNAMQFAMSSYSLHLSIWGSPINSPTLGFYFYFLKEPTLGFSFLFLELMQCNSL